MQHTLAIVERFLKQFGPEVDGRADRPLPPELSEQLQRFAHGGLDSRQRAELAETLKLNPEWIKQLADAVKRRRSPEEPA